MYDCNCKYMLMVLSDYQPCKININEIGLNINQLI